jgi:hypothetical protein
LDEIFVLDDPTCNVVLKEGDSKMMADQLCFGIFDQEGEICACSIANDLKTEYSAEVIPPGMQTLFTLLSFVAKPYKTSR